MKTLITLVLVLVMVTMATAGEFNYKALAIGYVGSSKNYFHKSFEGYSMYPTPKSFDGDPHQGISTGGSVKYRITNNLTREDRFDSGEKGMILDLAVRGAYQSYQVSTTMEKFIDGTGFTGQQQDFGFRNNQTLFVFQVRIGFINHNWEISFSLYEPGIEVNSRGTEYIVGQSIQLIYRHLVTEAGWISNGDEPAGDRQSRDENYYVGVGWQF